MQARRARKGLSPLVATVLLISATVIGGMLVYQYFQSSVAKAQGMGGGLMVTASATVMNDNLTLVKVSIVNGENDVVLVNASRVVFLDDNGNQIQPLPIDGTSLGKITAIEPGEKTVLIYALPKTPAAVIVEYEVNGETYQADPAQVTR